MSNLNLVMGPTSKYQLACHEAWLKKEFKKEESGFYINWKVIQASYVDGEVITGSVGKKVFGLVVWSMRDPDACIIDIMVVRPEFRKMGVGKEMLEYMKSHFKSHGGTRICLSCAPASSESYWRARGFTDYKPKHGYGSVEKNKLQLLI